MNHEEVIAEAKKECMPWKAEIVRCAKRYIEADHACRENKSSWMSIHPPRDTPKGAEYWRVSDEYRRAKADFFNACDVEYGDDPVANAAWEFIHAHVMARKCCWVQLRKASGVSEAGELMRKLCDAEERLMEVCGLAEMYNPASYYIEKQFPKLKMSK